MQRSTRLKAIIRAVESGPRRIAELVALTGASAVTIRRDLMELEERGALRRTHGGAQPAPSRGADFPFALRRSEDAEAKRAIADAAAALVGPGHAVFFDNGTTVLAIAHRLEHANVTALAVSLHAAAALASHVQNEVIVPGGTVNADDLSFSGSEAVDAVRAMRFDVAFLGACSADPSHGLSVATRADAVVKRAVIAASARVVLVVTAEKLTRTSAHRFGSFADVDVLVTTADAPAAVLHEARSQGISVVTVSTPPR